MEGAGQWAAYQFVMSRPEPHGSGEDALASLRGRRRAWSEDEGLALFLLLDALVPSWQAQIFGTVVASPFRLLEAALEP